MNPAPELFLGQEREEARDMEAAGRSDEIDDIVRNISRVAPELPPETSNSDSASPLSHDTMHGPAPDSDEHSPAVTDLSVITTRTPSQR